MSAAAEGYQAEQAQIVDASVIPLPIQRISREGLRRSLGACPTCALVARDRGAEADFSLDCDE